MPPPGKQQQSHAASHPAAPAPQEDTALGALGRTKT